MFKNNFIEIDSYKINYKDEGNSNSVVILLHGFALSSEIWNQNISALAQNHRVIALDILGFGQSDVPKEKVTSECLPDFIFNFMQKLNIKSAKFVGHSMGGLIALWISLKYPECVDRLTLVGSAGFKSNIPFHFRLFSLPLIGEYFIRPNKRGLKSALKRGAYSSKVITDALVNELYEAAKLSSRRKYYLEICRNAISFFGFKFSILRRIQNQIQNLKIPVLLIWGKEDKIICLNHGLRAKKQIPHSMLIVYDKCGHYPQLECPNKFNDDLNTFLLKMK